MRSQLLQVCVQKSISTTWPRNPAIVSGGDPSQADIPANSGAGPRSPSRSAWARLQGHALATTPSAMAVARALRRVAKGCVILLPAFQFKRSSVRELAATQMLRPNL